MNAIFTLLYLVLCGALVVLVPPAIIPYSNEYGALTRIDMAQAVLLCTSLAVIAGIYAYRQGANGPFLLRLFIWALLLRMVLGTAIFIYHGQNFFGGDATTYDYFGWAQAQGWLGIKSSELIANSFTKGGEGSGSGMVYMVGAIYTLVGRNMFATQLVNSVFGAATAIIIFLISDHLFNNSRVSRVAGIAVAFYPSIVLWSCQGLKDGPTVFFLALAILATLKLGQKLSITYIVALVVSLLAVLSFRFYVFYMIAIAVGGAFVVGMQTVTATSFLRQFTAMIVLGLALTYLGVTRSASVQFEQHGSLAEVQRSRLDLARSAKSGFGRDVDVSQTSGAISTIPMGMIYLLFAPFPWQAASLRQSITLPEMIVWWASFPLLITGLWFSIKYRLRMISPILIFTTMLSLAYSIVQGNVGTAYRQRAQLLVFYFIFVAVGLVLLKEKREERKRQGELQRRQLELQKIAAARARRRPSPIEPAA